MGKTRNFKRINIPKEIDVNSLSPLEISCGSTKCEDGFHCFSLKLSSIKKFGKVGVCKNCGADLIDWNRLKKEDLKDVNFLFNSLKVELFRHVVWHTKIEPKALQLAASRDKMELKERAKKILTSRIKVKSAWDGRQTPIFGNEITNIAQHATATCCRKCIEIWHGIPVDVKLSDEQIDYFTELVMLFINEKLEVFQKLDK